MILVDKATPLRLGELVRGLVPEHPDLDVEVDATRLAVAKEGQLVVLVPNLDHAVWLNTERPVVAQRRLSVVLFCDEATSKGLAQRAPDFFHWISHRVECPPAVAPAFAVARLRAAMLTRPSAIVWRGKHLEETFHAVRSHRRLELRPADLRYATLAQRQASATDWIAFDRLDSPLALRRVRWALAEMGRRGRVFLVDPCDEVPDLPVLEGTPSSLRAAIDALRSAGSRRPGQLAALADLDPVRTRQLQERVRAGVDDTSLKYDLLEPPASAGESRQSTPFATLPFGGIRRAPGGSPDPVEALLRARTTELRLVADLANEAGDPDAAATYAARWLAAQPDLGAALSSLVTAWSGGNALRWLVVDLATLADVKGSREAATTLLDDLVAGDLDRVVHRVPWRLAQGRFLGDTLPEAERSSEALLRKTLGEPGSLARYPKQEAQLCAELGALVRGQGRYAEAESFLDRGAVLAAEKLGESDPLTATLWSSLAQVRAQLHRDDARPTAERAIRLVTRALPADDPRRAEDLPVLERIASS